MREREERQTSAEADRVRKYFANVEMAVVRQVPLLTENSRAGDGMKTRTLTQLSAK